LRLLWPWPSGEDQQAGTEFLRDSHVETMPVRGREEQA
jgi:hypothetical protein